MRFSTWGPLVGYLLSEALGELAMVEGAFQGGACQDVVALIESEFGLAGPLGVLLLVFLLAFVEHVLICHGNGHLGFDLQELVLHVDDHLFDHLFGVFRLVHQIVEVGAD